jgi:hypothetical protein
MPGRSTEQRQSRAPTESDHAREVPFGPPTSAALERLSCAPRSPVPALNTSLA